MSDEVKYKQKLMKQSILNADSDSSVITEDEFKERLKEINKKFPSYTEKGYKPTYNYIECDNCKTDTFHLHENRMLWCRNCGTLQLLDSETVLVPFNEN